MKSRRRQFAAQIVLGHHLVTVALALAANADEARNTDSGTDGGQVTVSSSVLRAWGVTDSPSSLGAKVAVAAMVDVCTDALRQVETVRSETDALALNGTIESACVENVHRRLSDVALREVDNAVLKKMCSNLDGRLSLALEVGFQLPEHAEKADSLNSFAGTTRRSFCERFGASVGSSLQLSQNGPFAPHLKASPDTRPSRTVEDADVLESRAVLRLVQSTLAVTDGVSWNSVCNDLLSGLTSSDASVADADAKGRNNGRDATQFLAFNTRDKSRINRCAAKLKVLAIMASTESPTKPGAPRLRGALATLGLGATLSSNTSDADMGSGDVALEALVDRPWAHDVCDDMAHGFLAVQSLQTATAPVVPSQFCERYARDLKALEAAPSDDAMRLRRRAAEITRREVAKVFDGGVAVSRHHVALAAQHATVNGTSILPLVANETDDLAGEDFWQQ